MKAVRVNRWGEPIQIEDIALPTPASDEVLVRVHAASINPLDSAIRAGYLQFMLQVPLTLGTDFAGVVVETGPGVTHVQPGDSVYGMVPFHSGSFAEYLVAKSHEVACMPSTLDYVQAAGVPLASLAAFQSLVDLGRAQGGERVVIIGAGGSVGSTAIQLAKGKGLDVTGVTFADKASFVRGLGADRLIDAREERFEDQVADVDLVLDYVGGDYQQRSFKAIRYGGRYVTSLMPQSTEGEAERRGIEVLGLGTQPRVDQLDELARMIDFGRLKIFINRSFTLDQVQEALDYSLQKKEPGKIILTVQ